MITGNIKQVGKLIETHIKKKIPLIILGAPGIGKSENVIQQLKNEAKRSKLKFKIWNKLTEQEKKECEKNKHKYYMVFIETLSEYDLTDIKGLFDLTNKDFCSFTPQRWAVYCCDKNAKGCLFFDELTNAEDDVQKSAYKVIHDRTIGDNKLSDNVAIICAGNRPEDNCNVSEMPSALKDRMSEVEQDINSELTIEYFEKQDWCNHALLSYFRFKPDHIFRLAESKKDKATTPRGIERVMKLIGKSANPINYEFEMGGGFGDVVARGVVDFLKLSNSIDLNSIIKNPKKIKELKEISIKYAAIVALAEKFRQKPDLIKQMISISLNLDPEFQILLLRLLSSANEEVFDTYLESDNKDVIKCHKLFSELLKK